MPLQTPSDHGSPQKIGSTDGHSEPSGNGSNVDAGKTQPYMRQPPTALVPPPAPTAPPAAAARRAPVSRRSILRGVAGVGAAGAAAALGAGAVIQFDKPSALTLKPVSKPVAMAPMAPTAMAGPLVVYISDTTNGVLDVFGGTGATQVRNPGLVNQLLENLKLA